MRQKLTPLNLTIIEALLRYRLMTTTQIHRAVFQPREQPATEASVSNVMRRLHSHGFVGRDWLALKPTERSMLGRPSAIWFLKKDHLENVRAELEKTRRADLFEDLAPFGQVLKDGAPLADNTLRHELAITDFYSALNRHAGKAGRDIPLWLRTSPRHPDISRTVQLTKTDKKTGKQTSLRLPLNPDGFHVVRHPDKRCAFFLLEMDMNTETNVEKITNKFLAYYKYFEQDTFGQDIAAPFTQRYRLPITRPEAARFCVLFVTPNAKRRNDLLLKSRVLPTSNLFQFATLEDFAADPFGRPWLSKESFKDYLDEYNARTHAENPTLLRVWAHGILDALPRHAL
jgi:hypothetical protein